MYLDNAATTKIHPKVKSEMDQVGYANYNAKYYLESVATKTLIDRKITNLSRLLKVDVRQLVFTSGASESNNYIIKGFYFNNPNAHYITSNREHKCVIESFKYLQSLGADVTIIDCDSDVIGFDDIKPYIKTSTQFVSIMAVNNETGIINDFTQISTELRKLGIYYHSDITQAVGKIELDFSLFDFASLSAHKIHGPKGIGLAIVSLKTRLVPLIHGSTQQNSNRSGTLPNELVVGLCSAIELVYEEFYNIQALIKKNYETVIKFLKNNLGDDFILNFETNTVKNIISFRIKNEINQIFLQENSAVISASTGSSCSIGNPSYVLQAHNFSIDEIQETIRISTPLYEQVIFS